MDRIDIHLAVKRVPFQKLAGLEASEPSTTIRQRVEAARQVQAARFARVNKHNMLVNGDMGPAEVQAFCDLDEAGRNLMRAAMQQMNLSAQAHHRVPKLAGNSLGAIADLAEEGKIQVAHLAEAIQDRPRMGV
jgi:magnesium chelatase family protein